MSTISALEAQKKDKNRVNIYVDGEFFCGAAIDLVVRNRLSPGAEVSSADLADLRAASGEADLFNKTLAYVLASPKTERQVRNYLFPKADSAVAGKVVARLLELGYIDDAAYARLFVGFKGTKEGVNSIKNKLFMRGISAKVIEESLSDLDGQGDVALRTAEKYLRNKSRDTVTFQKLYRHLVAKGFDFDTAASVMEQVRAGKDEE